MGFDVRHELTQLLFAELRKHLQPIYRKEEERQKKSESQDLSTGATQRLNNAMRQLNKYLNELFGRDAHFLFPCYCSCPARFGLRF
jgi:hypothetical protein